MEEKIKEVLRNEIAPLLDMHGGRVSFVDFDEKSGIVKVRMSGACKGCALSELTLKEGIESILKSKFSQIQSVENIEN